MDNKYTLYNTKKTRHYLGRSNSLPIFNTYTNGYRKPIVSPEVLKMQMMEERLKQLEKQKMEQNEQLNALMSYQMEQNRLNNNPNALLLSANNILPPLGYRLTNIKKENGGYNPNEQNKVYIIKKDKKDIYRKQKMYEYKRNINELKDLLEKERMKRRMNRNIRHNIYNPIKNDINNLMDEMNYNFQKRIENDNKIMYENISEVQNNYDEMKYLLNNKMDKLELKQKMDFQNLRNELLNTANQNELEKRNIINNINDKNEYETELKNQLEEQFRSQRELDNIRHQRILDEIRRKHDLEDMENKKIMEDLRYKNMRNNILKKRIPQIIQQSPPMFQYPIPFMYPMPMPSYNNTGNNNGPSDELFKLFMMKQLFGEEMFPQKKKKRVKKYKYIYPPTNRDYHRKRKYSNFSSISDISNVLKKKKLSKKTTSKKQSKKNTTKESNTEKTTKKSKKKKKKEEEEEEEDEEEEEEEEDEDEGKEEEEDKEEDKEKEEEGGEDEGGEGEGEGEGGEDEGEE